MNESNNQDNSNPIFHHEDLALKTAAQYFGEELLPLLGITGKMVSIAPTELVHLEARQMFQDFNYVMEDGSWAHFEFESDQITTEDLRRFREYEATTSRAYHVAVTTYIVCSSSVKHVLEELAEGINVYRVIVIRLKNQNCDPLFQAAEQKAKEKKSLDRNDLVPLLLTPLMSGEMNIRDRILQSLHYLTFSSDQVSETDIGKMQAVLYTFADKFLNEQDLNQVKEMIVMTRLGQMLFNDGIEKGLQTGRQEGREKGQEKEQARYSRLILKLTSEGKTDLLIQAASDPALLAKLYKEYGLS